MKYLTNLLLAILGLGILLIMLSVLFYMDILLHIGVGCMVVGLFALFTSVDKVTESLVDVYTITINRNGELHQRYYKEFKEEEQVAEYCENVTQSYEDKHGLMNWEVQYEK